MSALRLLSPARSSSSRASSPAPLHTARKPTLNLRVPSYGSVFMPFPSLTPDTPRTDKELSGDLEIDVPRGYGRCRVKAIRVGVRTVMKGNFGKGREVEQNTLYETKVEVRGGTAEGVVLEEGLQRFSFTIIIPGTLAPHDYHAGHRIDNTLYAELEGVSESSSAILASPSTWFRRSSFSTPPSTRGHSPSSSRSSSPSIRTPPTTLSILRQEEPALLPLPPTYDQIETKGAPVVAEVPWVTGTQYAERNLILIYNPDPAGGVSSLDTRVDSFAPGIGPFSISYLSDEWSIAAPVRAKLSLPSPSPDCTVFFVRVGLVQTTLSTSPRDGAQIKIEKPFNICTQGHQPPLGDRFLSETTDAIWRGVQAGGTDEAELLLDGRGNMPNDYEGRPSTLEGVETPIRVSHVLRTEVWFSVHGEDARGNLLPDGGPGELRLLKNDKPVIVPACFLIPEVINLPLYEDELSCSPVWRKAQQTTCSLCKTPASEQFCPSCPPTAIPHPRHDHPPKLVGNASGVCPLCSKRVLPPGCGEWRDCACGMLREHMIERMKRVSLGDESGESGDTEGMLAMDADERAERRGRRRREEEKEAAERGR